MSSEKALTTKAFAVMSTCAEKVLKAWSDANDSEELLCENAEVRVGDSNLTVLIKVFME